MQRGNEIPSRFLAYRSGKRLEVLFFVFYEYTIATPVIIRINQY